MGWRGLVVDALVGAPPPHTGWQKTAWTGGPAATELDLARVHCCSMHAAVCTRRHFGQPLGLAACAASHRGLSNGTPDPLRRPFPAAGGGLWLLAPGPAASGAFACSEAWTGPGDHHRHKRAPAYAGKCGAVVPPGSAALHTCMPCSAARPPLPCAPSRAQRKPLAHSCPADVCPLKRRRRGGAAAPHPTPPLPHPTHMNHPRASSRHETQPKVYCGSPIPLIPAQRPLPSPSLRRSMASPLCRPPLPWLSGGGTRVWCCAGCRANRWRA